MKMRYVLPALMMSAFAFAAAPATAAPVAHAGPSTLTPLIVAQGYGQGYGQRYRHKKDYRSYHSTHRWRYVPGHRYRAAPHGWHRHRHRPRDWQHRGCILVGPVWFCP